MSKVHVSLRREDGTPTRAPISGAIPFSPTKRRTAGPDVILPAAFDAQLVDGEVVVELAATGPEWCWMVIEPTGAGIIRHIIVPDVEPSVVLEYSMLPDVDPTTLDPSAEPEAAWWAAIETMAGGWPLPAFRPDPDDGGALLVDLWSWQIASDDPNAMLVTVEV